MSDLRVDEKTIEALARGELPELERELVIRARAGTLKGVVTKPPRYSASSIQAFADCERKYLWPTVAGLDTAATESQRFGTKLHKHVELWLKDGTPPPSTDEAGRLAQVGLGALPKPNAAGMAVEEQFELRVPGLPVTITGTKDLVVRPSEEQATSFQLWDHKTMKDVRYFGEKTKPWLSGNIQANVYAFAEWVTLGELGFNNLRVVDKRWVYYFRRQKQVEVLRVVDDLGHVRERFEKDVVPLVHKMAAMAKERPRAGDVPRADESVCEAYGGCGHRARCFGYGLTGGGATVGILAGKFGKAAISAKVNEAQGKAPTHAATAVNPPAPRPYTPPKSLATAYEEANDPASTDDAPTEQEAPPPKKTAKPKGAEKKVAEVAAQTEKAFAPKSKGQDLRTPGSNPGHDFWLFLGCAPQKGFSVEPTLLEDIVGTAQANASQGMQSGHYREGYGLLEIAFAAWLEENALTGAVVVDPNSIVARDVLGLLKAHASVVIGRVQ